MSLDEFLESSFRNAWIRIGIFEIYARKSFRMIDGKKVYCLDLANIENREYRKRGQGYFRDLIKALAKTQRGTFGALYTESVINTRLAASLPSMGFSDAAGHEDTVSPSFYMLLDGPETGT